MKVFSAPSKWKINSQAGWLFLFMAALMTILLLPQPALGQERQIDLTLRLVPNRSNLIEIEARKDNILFMEEVTTIGMTERKATTGATIQEKMLMVMALETHHTKFLLMELTNIH